MTTPAEQQDKFVPMRRAFFGLYASVFFILLAFIANDMWFSRQVANLGAAIRLAGSEGAALGRLEQAEHVFQGVRYVLALLGVLLMSLNLLYLRRRLIQPIDALMQATEQMAEGQHAVRAAVCTNNEVMLLAQRFNRMAAAISSSFSAMEETIRQRSDDLTSSSIQMRAFADHLRLLMDSTGEGIYGIDAAGCCTFINRAGAAMLGYGAEELLGRNMHTAIHHNKPGGAPYPEAECPIFNAFRSGAAIRIDNEWLWRKDGSSLPVEYASNPIVVNGEIKGAVITFNDITEIVKAREERKKLFNAVEQSEESIVITDLSGAIEYVNPAFERKTGYSAAEARGQNPRILQSGKHPKSFYAAMWQILSRGEIWRGEIINKKKNGELYHEQVTISPVKNEKRETTHYVAIKNDITARKLAEEVILRKNRELERANKTQEATMRELQTAMAAAQEATRAKSDFLANMSHEIRTPMNAIIGMSHLIAKTRLDPQQADYVAKIDSAAKGLLGIINDILDFSKIEAGKLGLDAAPFSLDEVLRNLAGMTAPMARDKGLTLLLDLAPEVPRELIGDPRRLGQVLINLIGNAIKFTRQGEVALRVEAVERAAEAVLLRFAVRDSGIGMTEAQMGRLFQAFSQADTSTTREFGGTGLGLIISKQLVELMGGTIGAASEAGKGSTFFFTARFGCRPQARGGMTLGGGQAMAALGREDGHPPGAADEALTLAEPLAPLRGARVLLAEDNEINQQVAREILEGAGLVVVMANNGQEAVELAGQGGFDLILMDIQMPVLDGFAASAAICSLAGATADKPPIIAMTAHAMAGDRERSLAAGMVDHITKPIDPDLLLATLLRYIKPGQRQVAGHIQPGSRETEARALPPEPLAGARQAGLAWPGGGAGPSSESPAGAEATLLALLDRLMPHLSAGAPKPCRALVQEMMAYSWSEAQAATLRQLSTLVGHYKFQEAEAVVAALRERLTHQADGEEQSAS